MGYMAMTKDSLERQMNASAGEWMVRAGIAVVVLLLRGWWAQDETAKRLFTPEWHGQVKAHVEGEPARSQAFAAVKTQVEGMAPKVEEIHAWVQGQKAIQDERDRRARRAGGE